eukprot:scaffold30636_cov129-Isochrysis_galbana.AAC.9
MAGVEGCLAALRARSRLVSVCVGYGRLGEPSAGLAHCLHGEDEERIQGLSVEVVWRCSGVLSVPRMRIRMQWAVEGHSLGQVAQQHLLGRR